MEHFNLHTKISPLKFETITKDILILEIDSNGEICSNSQVPSTFFDIDDNSQNFYSLLEKNFSRTILASGQSCLQTNKNSYYCYSMKIIKTESQKLLVRITKIDPHFTCELSNHISKYLKENSSSITDSIEDYILATPLINSLSLKLLDHSKEDIIHITSSEAKILFKSISYLYSNIALAINNKTQKSIISFSRPNNKIEIILELENQTLSSELIHKKVNNNKTLSSIAESIRLLNRCIPGLEIKTQISLEKTYVPGKSTKIKVIINDKNKLQVNERRFVV